MTIEPLHPTHLPTLYDITMITDTWVTRTIPEFMDTFSRYGGWAIKHNNIVVGYIALMNHIPNRDIVIHCSVLPEYHTKWLTKSIYTTVFNYIFDELKVARCSSWTIEKFKNGNFLERLGFTHEGTVRKGFAINGKLVDLFGYGMLPDERRWK